MRDAEPFEFGLIIIGDEILGGRRQDRHLSATIERLEARGLHLSWALYAGDERERLAGIFRDTMATRAHVFCCGGIGATPDDVTRQAAADASERPIARHPEGEAILRKRFGDESTPHRLRLIEFPAGALLIPNPVNQVPGFIIDRHYFVPGFPQMAWPMLEWVLDERLGEWIREPDVSRSVRVRARESDLIPLLERLGAAHPDVRFSSLPEMHGDTYSVELGVNGPARYAEPAFADLEAGLEAECVPRVESGLASGPDRR